MDPKILKQYLLLHDNTDGTMDRAAGITSEMRSTFGSTDCRLLCINSSTNENGERKDNPWLNVKAPLSDNQKKKGTYLNVDDLVEIKDFMQELCSRHIIPCMRQKKYVTLTNRFLQLGKALEITLKIYGEGKEKKMYLKLLADRCIYPVLLNLKSEFWLAMLLFCVIMSWLCQIIGYFLQITNMIKPRNAILVYRWFIWCFCTLSYERLKKNAIQSTQLSLPRAITIQGSLNRYTRTLWQRAAHWQAATAKDLNE